MSSAYEQASLFGPLSCAFMLLSSGEKGPTNKQLATSSGSTVCLLQMFAANKAPASKRAVARGH